MFKKKLKKMLRFLKNLLRIFLNVLLFPIVLIGCVLARVIPKKMDIGIGPVPIINSVYWKKALELKGYKVETYVNDVYHITDQFDYLFNNNILYKYFPTLLFIWVVTRYKAVYIYFNGGPLQFLSIYRQIEPILFKIAGLKTVVMPYGADSHIFDITPNKIYINTACQDYPKFYRTQYKFIKGNVYRWSRYADIVIGAMDSIDYLFFWNRIRQCHFAIDTTKIQPKYLPPKDSIRILHAANHTNMKGSRFIDKAIKELKEEGYNIDYIFRHRIPNDEVLELIQSADIVIDQLIIGTYAMFSLEAMASGKPVICYLREDLVDLYETAGCVEQGEIPIISATPLTIKNVLRDLIERKDEWNQIGKKSRSYVEKYHSLEAVGDFFDEINKSLGLR